MSDSSESKHDTVSRRTFVQAAAATTAAIALPYPIRPRFRADPIRIGLVGCGGRGTGAVKDSLTSSQGVELIALGDLFPDRLASCRQNLAQMATEDLA